ncbi:unnamed protein product [Rhodiola kirilowii]
MQIIAHQAVPCAFLGYAFGQKGYKVFDYQNHVTYVSRDVTFVENVFPFAEDQKQNPVTNGSGSVTVYLPNTVTVPLPSCSTPATQFDIDPLLNSAPILHDSASVGDPPQPHSMQHQAPQRRTARISRPNVTLRDYVCNTIMGTKYEYPIHKCVNYSECSSSMQHYSLQVITDTEPTCYTSACKDQKWMDVMHKELDALQANNTWEITDFPSGKNPVSSKWIYRVKRKLDGSIERYKARLVARGFSQMEGLDYHETFAPVVKMNTVRSLLVVAVSKNWPLFHLDVDNTFLHGDLHEEVYMTPPPGFFKTEKAQGKVFKLLKSLYGLKQAPRQWFSKFSGSLINFGFTQSLNDYSLFTYNKNGDFVALLVYVDDVILTGSSSMARSSDRLFLNKRKYALELISETGLLACKPSVIPLESKHKLGVSTAPELLDPTSYRRLVGHLIYLTNTRPDLAYSVHILSQFMNKPTQDHLTTAHKVLGYLKGAPALGIFYPSHQQLRLEAYCDADWAACPLTRKSISGYAVLLGGALVFWKTKKQGVVSRSSAEAEYKAMAHVCCELSWLQRLLASVPKNGRLDHLGDV